ncbi:MAG: TonB-dependent receptor plug domain-containing protein, partial [Bacteroidales bacterium]|nr:TonB-dependent receptor plug domain-containing protein [Bacteroidales bacterium]
MSKILTITNRIALVMLLMLLAMASQAQIIMSGTVKNEKGTNMLGAYITVDDTNIATLTDFDGKFTLTIPDKYASSTVTVNYAGYIAETLFAADGDFNIVLRNREEQSIEDMVVSTQKRTQKLMDVPIALSVIDSAKIRQTSLYGLDEVSNFVPGFHATVPNAQVVFYCIRGVSSEEPVSYGQSRISVFMDGVSISRIQNANMEWYDMKQIDVSKGPQGTLFGRGAELGAVEFIRNKAADNFGIDLSMLYGNYNQRKVVGVINTPAGSVFAN